MSRTLLTFAPMIDCELSRFLLNHYGVAWRETPHLFVWVSVLSLWHAGTPQVPVLFGQGPALVGPRGIVDHYETICPANKKLIPTNSLLAMQVEADWARYNGILAGSTAVLGYYHLLPQRSIMMEPFSRGIPKSEVSVLNVAYPALAALFRLLLQLNAANARNALVQTRDIFEETDRRLADGRKYLVGDALTLSDLALATAAAPVLQPIGYGSPMPPFDTMPPEMKAIVSEMRQHPAAAFVQRIFQEYRQGG
jgi:glutathione S-transferase